MSVTQGALVHSEEWEIAMNDDDDKSDETALKVAAEMISSGDPILTFFIDEPLSFEIGPKGELAINFVWTMVEGYSTAATARAVLSLEAAGRLKAALSKMQNIPDTPPEGHGQRSKH